MESKIYVSYGTLISPLGIGVKENYRSLQSGISGIAKQPASGFRQEDWFLSKINQIQQKQNRFNTLLEIALEDLKKHTSDALLKSKTTIVILSSTKGNIDDLPNDVFASARQIIQQQTENPNDVIVISNACISGVLAVNTAADYLRYSDFDNAIVIGIDALSDFVVFGFQSLFAISDEACRPFDKDRKGVSLGEACGIVVVSKEKSTHFSAEYLGGASSNDANHISGPSRTGEGLFRAINRTIERANISRSEIDFISAHGTGTLYNDEMESIAFTRCELQSIPTNSLKGFFGHTLGAAGVIELIVCLLSIEHQLLFESKGFKEQGTTQPLHIIEENQKASVQTILKTASGFGGGNAAIILKAVS